MILVRTNEAVDDDNEEIDGDYRSRNFRINCKDFYGTAKAEYSHEWNLPYEPDEFYDSTVEFEGTYTDDDGDHDIDMVFEFVDEDNPKKAEKAYNNICRSLRSLRHDTKKSVVSELEKYGYELF